MNRFSVCGSAGAPTAGRPFGHLWNPSSSVVLYVHGADILSGAALNIAALLRRTTTIGTPGSTVTPDADNEFTRKAAPASGATLGLADYTVNPLVGQIMKRLRTPSVVGSGGMWQFAKPIQVPPGTGLGLFDNTGVIAGAVVTFEWSE